MQGLAAVPQLRKGYVALDYMPSDMPSESVSGRS